VKVGSIELAPVPDAMALLGEYSELYPEVPGASWEPFRTLYPDLFSGTTWRLPCTCFLVRSAGTTVLVDTGLGPPGLTGWELEEEGRLSGSLGALGVAPDDVDVVFLTHLHIDHVGWNADSDGNPSFPRARYVVHEDALAFARSQDTRPHVRRCILPLDFETVAGDVELAAGVTAFEAPGHYAGHMALRLADDASEAVLVADFAVHPALLQEPAWLYVSDVDPAVTAETRRALLPEFLDRDVLVACGHYPGSGIGRVVTRGDRVVWEEAT
jgi:glyoxylase-like metal-dependent hydrolase (beta-lactamase superfamily II)